MIIIQNDLLTDVSTAERWPRSRGRSSRRVNEIRSLDSWARRTTRMQSPPGGRTSIGSFKYSMCVRMILFDDRSEIALQTELLMNNHMMLLDNNTTLMDNNTMLSDIHRNVFAGQDDSKGQNRSVSTTFSCTFSKNTDCMSGGST